MPDPDVTRCASFVHFDRIEAAVASRGSRPRWREIAFAQALFERVAGDG
jgi:hypothetical protein